MATWTVKQSGGDYSTLASALSNASTVANDTISIEGTWTVDDTTAASVSDDNITIQTDASSKHPGYYDTTTNHYRLVISSGNCITINNSTTIIDGVAMSLTSTTSSDEGVRVEGDCTIKNCIIQATTATASQDGVYSWETTRTTTLENCMIYGFGRGGSFPNSTSTGNVCNINSCTFWNNASTTSSYGGNITGRDNTNNVFNTLCLGTTNHTDFNERSSVTWGISYCVDTDNSIATYDTGGAGNLASRTETDNTSPGAGDWVIVQNITSSPYDLRLVSNAENDAEDAHSVSSAEGLTIPSTDIVGTTRATAYEIGAFTIAAAGGLSIPIAAYHYNHNVGSNL